MEYDHQKVCIDCGKLFDPISQMNNDGGNVSYVPVCKDCTALLRKRFWNSMKIGIKQGTVDDQDNQSKDKQSDK